jgi:peptidoglycan-associated lipoprotein
LVPDEEFEVRSLEDLNRDSPLEPVFFKYDSSSLEEDARAVLEKNAKIIEQYPDWIITVEGHCDERGTAEYNLSLGERRAVIARDYLVEMGLPAIRLRTVSYGKEFPFDPANTEMALSKNRRAHFVISAR